MSANQDEDYEYDKEFELYDDVTVDFGEGGLIRGYVCAVIQTSEGNYIDLLIHGGDLNACKFVVSGLDPRSGDYTVTKLEDTSNE